MAAVVENGIVFLLFLLAIAYLGNLARKQFFAKSSGGCAKGCGACGTIDFKKIEAQLAAKQKRQLETREE